MILRKLTRGMEVTVLAFGGKELRRRVWKEIGNEKERAVFVCTEEEYRRAIRVNDEANASGFSKQYVLCVHNPLPTDDAEGEQNLSSSMLKKIYHDGAVVTARTTGNEQVRRRVWMHLANAVLLTTEAEYQRSVLEKNIPRVIAFREEAILETHPAGSSAD